ncbi:MAG: fluoride efflux transporter CrcB [Dehalococcoidia bacterium]|nr:fluoride efflux transporter CrcB [Dehalococcoidia bacterium]|tara:strand:+ start:416 stop:796 length:381 start_codon:yes stop_codon:yes gene_type:complete
MLTVIFIGIGGFLGSIFRYGLTKWVDELTKHQSFPSGTVAVNVLGCLVIGVAIAFFESRQILNSNLRSLIIIGILGGFTTFSTFSLQNFELMKNGESLAALANIGLSVCLGLTAVYVGYSITSKLT